MLRLLKWPYESLRDKIVDRYEARHEEGSYPAFTRLAKWSTLRGLGESYLVKLTILAPFLGSIILFNKTVIDYLSFSTEFLGAIGIDRIETNRTDSYFFDNLLLLYIALFILGVASVIYTLAAPESVSRFGTPEDFASRQSQLGSEMLCLDAFENIIDKYAQHRRIHKWMRISLLEYYQYSRRIESLTYSLLESIHSSHDWSDTIGSINEEQDDEDAPEPIENDNPDLRIGPNTAYHQANGYLNIDAMCRDMVMAPRVLWAVTVPLKKASLKFQSDVYYIQYKIDDLSRPLARASAFLFYVIGFIVLFIPSVETFIRVLVYSLFG